ncbi:hypothetical protein LBMAG45_07600 [Nitrospirota bacterium]|nr:hypothetical protein LBMAG45_07600 [Nitrospirota bacterium]
MGLDSVSGACGLGTARAGTNSGFTGRGAFASERLSVSPIDANRIITILHIMIRTSIHRLM